MLATGIEGVDVGAALFSFGIRLSIRGVGEYLTRWGYTPQKAARRAYERDDAAVMEWLTIEYPKIRALSGKTPRSTGTTSGRAFGPEPAPWLRAAGSEADREDPGAPQEPVDDRGGDEPRQGALHDLPLNSSEYFNGDLQGEIQRGMPSKDVTDPKRTVLGPSRRIQKSPARVWANSGIDTSATLRSFTAITPSQ